MWGLERAVLFSVADYTQIGAGEAAAGLITYGNLKYQDAASGSVANLKPQIESFALDSDGIGYIAYNVALTFTDGQPTVAAPVLVKIDTAAVTTAGPNVVTIVGSVPLPAGLNEDAIRGLSFDPISGDLYGALKVPSAVDRLVKISAADASLVDIGPIQSAALGVTAENAEDIEFDDAGKLYVSDRTADDLYQVDPATGAILAIVDNDLPGGLGLAADNPVDVEALAWDPALQQMVGIEDEANLFYLQTFDNGNNVPLGVLSQLGSTSLHRFCHSPQNARHRHGEDDQRPIELQPDRSRL